MYNVRVKRFFDSEQIQIFSEPMVGDGEREDKRKVILSTGEIVPVNKRIIYNPFLNVNYEICYCNEYGNFRETKELTIDYMCWMGDSEENLKRSVRRTKNAISDLARSNDWHWFITMTFDPEKVDSFNYAETTKKLSVWFMNMRKKAPNMKYLVVPEVHKSGRWHFHGLFADSDGLEFVESGLVDDKGRSIYNVHNYRLGFTTATRIDDVHQATTYILKYISKDLCAVTKGKKRYWHSRNCLTPIIEDYLVSMSNEELQRVMGLSLYTKKTYSEYVDVTYLELPIYTTNTMRFLTNEEQD